MYIDDLFLIFAAVILLSFTFLLAGAAMKAFGCVLRRLRPNHPWLEYIDNM